MSRLDVELEYIRRQSVLEQYRHAAEELSKEVEAGHVEQSVVDMAVNYAKALREEQDRWAYIIALLHKPRFNKKFLKKKGLARLPEYIQLVKNKLKEEEKVTDKCLEQFLKLVEELPKHEETKTESSEGES